MPLNTSVGYMSHPKNEISAEAMAKGPNERIQVIIADWLEQDHSAH